MTIQGRDCSANLPTDRQKQAEKQSRKQSRQPRLIKEKDIPAGQSATALHPQHALRKQSRTPRSNHGPHKTAGQTITVAITAITAPDRHGRPPPLKRGGGGLAPVPHPPRDCTNPGTYTQRDNHRRWTMTAMPGAPARHRRLRVNLDPEGIFPTRCRGKKGMCARPPYIGAPVCPTHGAFANSSVRRAADRRVTQAAAERTLRSMLLNLDAEPIRDPAAALMRLAARFESGFEETAKRINAAIDAGGVPSETDVALLRILGREARTVVTDMTRLQVGVQLASRYAEQADVEAVMEGDVVPVLADLPDVSSIVAAVLETEHRLETDRLVKVEQARSMGVTQGQLPAELTIVGETEQAS